MKTTKHLLEDKKILELIKSMAKNLAQKQENPMISWEDLESEAYHTILKNYDAILKSPSPFQSTIRNAKNSMINELRKYNKEKGLFEELKEEKDGETT